MLILVNWIIERHWHIELGTGSSQNEPGPICVERRAWHWRAGGQCRGHLQLWPEHLRLHQATRQRDRASLPGIVWNGAPIQARVLWSARLLQSDQDALLILLPGQESDMVQVGACHQAQLQWPCHRHNGTVSEASPGQTGHHAEVHNRSWKPIILLLLLFKKKESNTTTSTISSVSKITITIIYIFFEFTVS